MPECRNCREPIVSDGHGEYVHVTAVPWWDGAACFIYGCDDPRRERGSVRSVRVAEL